MDWIACKKCGMVKEARTDFNSISSIMLIAESKVKANNALNIEHYYSKITLLYDAIRSYLECMALKKGFKIYNHECYTAFLKEVLNESYLGDEFDKFRIIRNGINYYGKDVSKEEGQEIIKRMEEFMNKIKKLLKS